MGEPRLTAAELDDAEHTAAGDNSFMAHLVLKLVNEVRSLQHELADPNYQYSSGRIHRQAILCRDAEIDRLRKELEKLKGK